MTRLASPFVALGFAMIIPRGSGAQDRVQVLRFDGTKDEQTQIQTIIKRVKDRAAADATIVTKLEDAYKLKDYAGMKKLFAAVAQVSAGQVVIGESGKLSLREPSRPTFATAFATPRPTPPRPSIAPRTPAGRGDTTWRCSMILELQ